MLKMLSETITFRDIQNITSERRFGFFKFQIKCVNAILYLSDM